MRGFFVSPARNDQYPLSIARRIIGLAKRERSAELVPPVREGKILIQTPA